MLGSQLMLLHCLTEKRFSAELKQFYIITDCLPQNGELFWEGSDTKFEKIVIARAK